MSRIYVGNLPFTTQESEVEALFAQHGEVVRVKIMVDGEGGRSRGFGFVEMSSEEERTVAITSLHGAELGGRELKVSEARERKATQSSDRD